MNRDDIRYKLRLLASPFEDGTQAGWEHVEDMELANTDHDEFLYELGKYLYDYLHDMDEYTEPFTMTFKVDLLTDKQVLDDY